VQPSGPSGTTGPSGITGPSGNEFDPQSTSTLKRQEASDLSPEFKAPSKQLHLKRKESEISPSSTLNTFPLAESTRNDFLASDDTLENSALYLTAESIDLNLTDTNINATARTTELISLGPSSSSSVSTLLPDGNTGFGLLTQDQTDVDITVLKADFFSDATVTDNNKDDNDGDVDNDDDVNDNDDDGDVDDNGNKDKGLDDDNGQLKSFFEDLLCPHKKTLKASLSELSLKNDTDNDNNNNNNPDNKTEDKDIQTSFSSASSSSLSSSNVSVVEVEKEKSSVVINNFSIFQTDNPDHPGVTESPKPLSLSAPSSPGPRSSASRRTPSSAPSSPSEKKKLNKAKWLKGQGIDSTNIVEGKRFRKPKKLD